MLQWEANMAITKTDYKAMGVHAKQHYIEQQLFQPAPLSLTDANYGDGFDMQIRSVFGKTNWLRISAAQLRQIEDVLRGE